MDSKTRSLVATDSIVRSRFSDPKLSLVSNSKNNILVSVVELIVEVVAIEDAAVVVVVIVVVVVVVEDVVDEVVVEDGGVLFETQSFLGNLNHFIFNSNMEIIGTTTGKTSSLVCPPTDIAALLIKKEVAVALVVEELPSWLKGWGSNPG